MATATITAAETAWQNSATALYTGDIDGFLQYWTPGARYEVAYPIAGFPAAVEGHDQLRALFSAFAALAKSIRVENVRFHQTADPDVAFVEERMIAELHVGSRYENDLIMRVTFDNGLIAEVVEYYGERAHEDLLRRVGPLG